MTRFGDFLIRADVEFLAIGSSDASLILPLRAAVLLLSLAFGLHAFVEFGFLQPQRLACGIPLGKIFLSGQRRETGDLGVAIIATLFGNRPVRGVGSRIGSPGCNLPPSLLVLLRPCG